MRRQIHTEMKPANVEVVRGFAELAIQPRLSFLGNCARNTKNGIRVKA